MRIAYYIGVALMLVLAWLIASRCLVKPEIPLSLEELGLVGWAEWEGPEEIETGVEELN